MYAPRDEMLRYGSHLNTFVETGTYHGETAEWASTQWPVVHTVEKSPSLFKPKPEFPNVRYYLGDSREVLKGELGDVIANEPCVFWLDGHWFDHGDSPAGSEDDCPLMRELDILDHTDQPHVIFIDDAHLIKKRHKRYLSWPTEDDIRKRYGEKWDISYVENTILMKRK